MKKVLFVGSALTASLALGACGATSQSVTAPAATATSYKIVSGSGQVKSIVWIPFTVTPGACITNVNTASPGTGSGDIQIITTNPKGTYPGTASVTWIAANGLSAGTTINIPSKNLSNPVELTATTALNFTAPPTASMKGLSLVLAAGC